MAGMAIPPAIVRVLGTIDTLVNKIAQAKALLETFGASDINGPTIQPTIKTLPSRIEAAKAEIKTILDAHPIDVPIEISSAKIAAEMAATVVTADRIASAHPPKLVPEVTVPALLRKIAIAAEEAGTVAHNYPITFTENISLEQIIEDLAAARADHLTIYTEVNGKAVMGNLVAEHMVAQAWLDAHPLDERLKIADATGSSILQAIIAGAAAGRTSGGGGFWSKIFGNTFGGFIGSSLGSISGAVTGALTGLFSNIFGDALQIGAKDAESGIQSIFQQALGAALPAAGSIGTAAAGLGTESLVISPIIATFLTLISAVVGGILLLVGALGTLAVGLGTSAAGTGQAIGDITKVWQVFNTPTLTTTQKAQEIHRLLATMPQAVRGANGPLMTFIHTMTQFRTLFDKLTGPAEAAGIKFLTQLLGVVSQFLVAIRIGTEAKKSVHTLQTALQPFFHWLLTSGVKLYSDIESTALSLESTSIKAFTSGLELLGEVINDVGPSLGKFTSYLATEFTKLATKTQGKVQHFVQTMLSAFTSVFDWVKSLVDLFKTVAPDFAGLGKAMFKTWTEMIQTFTAYVTHNQSMFKQFFTVHKGLINTGVLGILKALMPLLEDLITAFMQLAIVLRPITTSVLEAAAGVLNAINTIFRAFSDASHGTYKALVKIFTTGPKEFIHSVANMFTNLWHDIENHIPGWLQAITGIHPPTQHGIMFSVGGHRASTFHTKATPYQFGINAATTRQKHFKSLQAMEKFLGVSGLSSQQLYTDLYGLRTSGDTLAQIKAALQKDLSTLSTTGGGGSKSTGVAVGKNFGKGVVTGVSTTIKSTLQPVVAAIASTKGLVSTIAKAVATPLTKDLEKSGGAIGAIFAKNLHKTLVANLKSTTIAKNFTTHFANELSTTSKPIQKAAAGIGTTDIHEVIWKNLKANILGKTFDQHLAQAITKTKSVVVTAAYNLGVAARKAYIHGASGGNAPTGNFNPGRNNPAVVTHPHSGR